MAIDIMARIPDRADFDSFEKLVLLIMADRADEDGLLWYANGTIARKCSMTVRGVQKVLERLIQRQIVKKMHRHDRSNFYIINVDMLPRVEVQRPAKEKGPVEYLQEEPDLFGAGRGERGSGRRGERGSGRGEPGSVRGERGSSDSLIDPDMIPEPSSDDLLCRFVSEGWEQLLKRYPDMAPFPPMTDERKRGIIRRTEEHLGRKASDRERIGLWTLVLEQIAGSKLLTGQATDWPGASLDWLLKKSNFGKLVGKQYGNGRDAIGTAGRNDRSAVEAGLEALDLVRGHRDRSQRQAQPAR